MPISITMEELLALPISDLHSLSEDMLHQIDESIHSDPGSMSDAQFLKEIVKRLLTRSRQLSEIKNAKSIKTIATVLEDVDE